MTAPQSSAPHEVRLISFIVPAWNEEACLGRTLQALRAAARALPVPHEIIVVDDASSDRTAEIARAHQVRVLSVHHRQIAATRNAGARAARGDLLAFVDADTVVSRRLLPAMLEAVRAGAVGGGCLERFDEPTPRWLRALVPCSHLFRRLVRLANGCFLFCRREAFEAVGGFDPGLFAAEEVALSRALRRRGRFIILGEYVITSGRKARTHAPGELLGMLFRIGLRGRRALRDRRELGLWYGTRRPDLSQRD